MWWTSDVNEGTRGAKGRCETSSWKVTFSSNLTSKFLTFPFPSIHFTGSHLTQFSNDSFGRVKTLQKFDEERDECWSFSSSAQYYFWDKQWPPLSYWLPVCRRRRHSPRPTSACPTPAWPNLCPSKVTGQTSQGESVRPKITIGHSGVKIGGDRASVRPALVPRLHSKTPFVHGKRPS